MRRIVLGSVALALVLGVVACGTDDPVLDSSSTSTTSTTISTSTARGSETTGSTAPSVPASNAEEYARALVDAWTLADRGTAETLALRAAVDTLFAYESGAEEGGPEVTWTLERCEGAAGSSYCTFSAGGDPKIVVRVMNEAASTGQLRAISEVRVES